MKRNKSLEIAQKVFERAQAQKRTYGARRVILLVVILILTTLIVARFL